MNIELLQTKCCDFRFNLPKLKLLYTCCVSLSSVGVFFSNLFRFNEMVCKPKKA